MTKPALTAEEWADVLESVYPPVDHIAQESPEDPYKAAALCLYGQPFGFTREDVSDLRRLANVKACGAIGDGITDDTPAFQMAFRIADLAERIEALLPPEKV